MDSYVEFSKAFNDEIVQRPIPLDLEVMQQLGMPRAMDIYAWLTLKKFWLSNRTETQWVFSWDDMAANFSTKELKTSQDRVNFRNEIKKAIATVTTFWPNAGITADLTGVTIQCGHPSIIIKPKKVLG